MKIFVLVLGMVFAFLLGDFLWGQKATDLRPGRSDFMEKGVIPFDHEIHGDSIGLDCSACHTGARSGARALKPSRRDCMDCHRLPLTESAGIEKLDSALKEAPEHPWNTPSRLPEHVVFHHGVHASAGVACSDCHGGASRNNYGGENFDMKSCLQCHRGETFKDRNFKKAAVYCAACHR